jgi:hypothetical protein
MIFHDCMPVLLSTGCLFVRCPLAVCPFAVHWLSILLSTGCLSCCSLAVCPSCCPLAVCPSCCSLAVCPFAVHWLSVRCPLAVCSAVHYLSVRCLLAVYPADQWLFVRSLSTNCLSVRCPLAVRSLCTGWLSVRCLGRISIRQLHVIARISTLQQYTSTF